MPQWRQKRCFAAPVLNVYSVSSSAPASRRKRAAGTIRWRKPVIRQIEQLQSSASMSAGASTSKRTRPQWQPPRWMVRLIAEAYSTVAVAVAVVLALLLQLAGRLRRRTVRFLARTMFGRRRGQSRRQRGLALGEIRTQRRIEMDRSAPAVVARHEAALEPVEGRRARRDAQSLRQRAPAVAVVLVPFRHHCATRSSRGLRE